MQLVEIITRHKIQELSHTAWNAYHIRRLSPAVELFKEALRLAESLEDIDLIDYFRDTIGICQYQLGRLREALTVLAPILQKNSGSGDKYMIFNALIHYIQTAQRLPIRLVSIKNAYQQTESFLRDIGHVNWRHELLVMRVRLHNYCGMPDEALRTAQEAWALWRQGQSSGYSGQVADFHFDGLISVCLRCGESQLAKEYFQQWERQPDVMPVNRQVRFSRCYADFLRTQGHVQEAIRWARRAVLAAETTDYQETRFASFISLVRAQLAAGECEEACVTLRRFLQMRRSESDHDRAQIYLLLGDYHLACVRRSAQMNPCDDDFQKDLFMSGKFPNIPDPCRDLGRARRMYTLAMQTGQEIDDKLECSVWRHLIAKRRERLAGIEKGFTNGK